MRETECWNQQGENLVVKLKFAENFWNIIRPTGSLFNSIDYFDGIIEIFPIVSICYVIPSITIKNPVTVRDFPGILSPLRTLIE